MKTNPFRLFYCIFSFVLFAHAINAQVFNFYGTEFFTSADSSFNPGTQLTASGTNLSDFNFTNADPEHPLFKRGVYFPVRDCGNRNLWVRLQHIGSDPNGAENGFNIEKTLNSPFLPLGSTDRIGGWAGFLYDIRIFADQNIEGSRSNKISGAFPTNITVESLETLYNDGNVQFEWLSFEILNEESEGWSLNSTNFTGINIKSNPGFSAEKRYSSPVQPGAAPEGFSTEFPAGSRNIYAIDLNLSNAEHSEFRMSASKVSHFRYGYEFNSGGYQGMSMAFGAGPEVNALLKNPQCAGDTNGVIELTVTGYEPISYVWSNGDTAAAAKQLSAGNYEVKITDQAGCSVIKNFKLNEPDSLQVYITLVEESNAYLRAVISGGTGSYVISWNTGEESAILYPTAIGSYTVKVTDEKGCIANAQFEYLSADEVEGGNQQLRIYPNPVNNGIINLSRFSGTGTLNIFDVNGKCLFTQQIVKNEQTSVALPNLSPGIYYYKIGTRFSGRLLIQ